MTRLILVAHAPLASALRDVAMHTFPEAGPVVAAVDVAVHEAPQAVAARLQAALAGSDDGALLLCDVEGATPCNIAGAFAQEGRVHVVAGVNVPMVWRVLCYRSESLASLTERALAGGAKGIGRIDGTPEA